MLARSLLRPETLPRLRHLGIHGQSCLAKLLLPLVPQLQTLSLRAIDWEDYGKSSLRSFASRILVDCSVPDFAYMDRWARSVEHVRVSYFIDFPPPLDGLRDADVRRFGILVDFVADNLSLPLRSIYLDSSLGSSPSVPKYEYLQVTLERLISICDERKIDIVYEDVPYHLSVNSVISGGFVRRQRDNRDEKASMIKGTN